ncbi:Two-component system response regulator [Caenispirillum salinarum AK4]|uniref:Two-component system response regulator n=1 Tax=Caenispirillum salinarum AK4 TaxID=1238182 RepID=K9HB64_9PROT|nr:response regulator [Caenispirillum salinarum]EKV26016.1 Two-component system response regulator [Caenispirillum salinarum AK4]
MTIPKGDLPPLILMVDDNRADVELTHEALLELPVVPEFQSVSDGLAALEYLHQRGAHAGARRPDLILLDLNMPRMDGRATLEALKADEALCDIPVVVLTTSESERDVLDCYRKHCAAFLTKPVTVEELIGKLEAVCQLWLSGVAALPRRPVRH